MPRPPRRALNLTSDALPPSSNTSHIAAQWLVGRKVVIARPLYNVDGEPPPVESVQTISAVLPTVWGNGVQETGTYGIHLRGVRMRVFRNEPLILCSLNSDHFKLLPAVLYTLDK
jgi:hypothetical protein